MFAVVAAGHRSGRGYARMVEESAETPQVMRPPATFRHDGSTLVAEEIGAALAGGTAPLLATWLLARFDGAWWPIATYLVILAVISFAAVAVSGRVVRKESALIAAREAAERNEKSEVSA